MPPATRREKAQIKIKENTTNDCSPSEPLEEVEEKVLSKREELLSLWKVASVAQFVSLYRFDFKLPEIEIEQLEDGLLQENELGRKTLQELLLALLKGIWPSRGIKPENFEQHLQKFIKKHWEKEENQENPWTEEKSFTEVDIKSQVDILYFLCIQRVSCADAAEALKDMDSSALRVQPLGCDDQGNDYWYFYGTRLYKQEPSKEKKNNSWQDEWNEQKDKSFNKRGRGRPKKTKPRKSDGESDDFEDVESRRNRNCMNIDEKSRWSVVCNTMEDWVDFAEKFKDSKSKCEKALFMTVKTNFLPALNDIYQEKERKLQQKLNALIPQNHIITRRETRQQRVKSMLSTDMNGYSTKTAHKEHMAKDRARRLEERNRRSSQPSSERGPRKRSRNRSFAESDYEDEDSYESCEMDSSYSSAFDDYRSTHMPAISNVGSDLKSQVLRVLNEVRLLKDAWPFLYRVNEASAPRYYEIISEPMDLSVMCEKVENNCYGTIKDIDEDFQKMVSNCKLYNGEDSGLYQMVMNLWKVFRKGMTKLAETPAAPLDSSASSSGSSYKVDQPQRTKVKPADTYRNAIVDSSQGKGKKKARHMEALEMLSRQSELAVEKAQSMEMDDSGELPFQPKTYSQFSDLKIVPIHSHPSSLIEKFMSDSSNQDSNDTEGSNDNSPSFESEDSPPPFVELNSSFNESEKKECAPPTIHYIVNKEGNEDVSDVFNKNNARNFNILSDGEGSNQNILSETEIEMDSVPNTDVSSSTSYPVNSKPPRSSEDLVHGVRNILEECSGVMSGLQSGSLCDPSSGKQFVSSYDFGSTSSGPSRKSPHNPVPCFSGPTIEDRNISNLREGFEVQELSNFSTVDVSALGISSSRSLFKKQNDHPLVVSVEAQDSFSLNRSDHVPPFHQMHQSLTMPILESSPKSKPRYSPTALQQMESQLYSLSQQNESHSETRIMYGENQVDRRLFMNQNHATYSKHQEDSQRSRPRHSPILLPQSMSQNQHPAPIVSDKEIERELAEEHMRHQTVDRMPSLNEIAYAQSNQEESTKDTPRYSPTLSPQDIPQSHLCSSPTNQQSNETQKETLQMYAGNQSVDKRSPPNQMHATESNHGESPGGKTRHLSAFYPQQMSNQLYNLPSGNQQGIEDEKIPPKTYNESQTGDKMTPTNQANAPVAESNQDEFSRGKAGHSPPFYPPQMLQNDMSNQVPQQQIQVQKSSVRNIFSNATAPGSNIIQVHPIPPSTNSGPQIPMQVPYGKMFPCESSEFSKQDGNKFPSMKVTLPPSTGEIVLVPGEPDSSTMTFHLYAQPHANPSEVIQSRLELQANTSPSQNNVEAAKSAANQVTTTIKKGTIKNDIPSQPLKRKSPAPEKQPSVIKSTSPTAAQPPYEPATIYKYSDGKTTLSDLTVPGPVVPPSYANNYPPIIRMDSNVSMVRPDGYHSLIRPNAMSARQLNPVPYTTSEPSLDGLRNNPLYTKTLPVMMPSYRVPNVCGSNVITTNSSSVRQSVQRICVPSGPLQINPNTLVQNGNGLLYPFAPSTKEEVAKPQNGDPGQRPQNQIKPQSETVTTSSYYTSANGVLQSFPYQSAPMNPSIFTQVPNQFSQYPYYIVADPNTFQNPGRFSVMQPIPFPNR